ncbi:MAG: chemotaxis response regulator protein-glutamate methylesterase, partial [Verrucomicrobiales bacterium]|nr:chemotaxis response regulator protein-glutamate methylesterase [Verrucomicrobiales bacterium]
MNPPRKIRVLVVDDSALVRRAISDALGRDPEIEVVGTAVDPYIARDRIRDLSPDVLTLDIEMPRMDGLTFLRLLQQHRPMPVVVISSTTASGSEAALKAMEYGAVDVLCKPTSAYGIGELGTQLPARVKAAARARIPLPRPAAAAPEAPRTVAWTGDAPRFSPKQLVVIGASTGGTEAVKQVLSELPGAMPGICIVQHIPPVFSRAFAERLDRCCDLEVREAVHDDAVRPGLALVAPGDQHMAVEWSGGGYRVRLNRGPMLHHTRPAVDVLFGSASTCPGARVTAVILTGMGCDGALGMKKLRDGGAVTIAQNEETCMVYGMPRAAVEMGVVDRVLPLGRIAGAVVQAVRDQSDRGG